MSCTSCGHDPHAGACPRTIAVRQHPGRPAKPVDLDVDCPCVRRQA